MSLDMLLREKGQKKLAKKVIEILGAQNNKIEDLPILTTIIKDVNTALNFFQSTLKAKGITFKKKDWDPSVMLGMWGIANRAKETPFDTPLKCLKTLCYQFDSSSKRLDFSMSFKPVYAELKKDVKNYWKLEVFISKLFKDLKSISVEKAEKALLPKFNIAKNSGLLESLTLQWAAETEKVRTPAEVTKLGKALEAIQKDIPAALRKAPGTLYRSILVPDSVLTQIKNKKSIKLPTEGYTSWSYKRTNAEDFAMERAAAADQSFILLKKTFPDTDIILNVQKALKFFKLEDEVPYAMEEKEVIVKQPKNLVVKLEEIISFMKDEDWTSTKKL